MKREKITYTNAGGRTRTVTGFVQEGLWYVFVKDSQDRALAVIRHERILDRTEVES